MFFKEKPFGLYKHFNQRYVRFKKFRKEKECSGYQHEFIKKRIKNIYPKLIKLNSKNLSKPHKYFLKRNFIKASKIISMNKYINQRDLFIFDTIVEQMVKSFVDDFIHY